MARLLKPDYKNSVLNITATLAEFLGCKNSIPTIPLLKKELKKNYKNVVFICFDGLGINPLEKNCDEPNVLTSNIKKVVKSTFPSTTTNATTSLLTNMYPLEHGWLGWSLYFESVNKCVDIFLDRDNYTLEKLNLSKKDRPITLPEYYFYKADSNYHVSTVFPSYVKVKDELNNYVYSDKNQFVDSIVEVCKRKEKQFVYAYYPEPDATMHDYGVSSNEAKTKINEVIKIVEKLQKNTKNTLFVISADHGQIDVEGYVEIYKDKEIMSMLKTPIYLEPRAAAFRVKEECKDAFESMFNERYSKDFTLFKTNDLIEQGYFGKGDKGELLGDFIAVGTYTHKTMIFHENSNYFKGHHTGLTEEMKVPLIIINN